MFGDQQSKINDISDSDCTVSSQTHLTGRTSNLKHHASSPAAVFGRSCAEQDLLNQSMCTRVKDKVTTSLQTAITQSFTPISYIILGQNGEKQTLPWQECEIISNNNISFSCETKYPALCSHILHPLLKHHKYLKWTIFIKTHLLKEAYQISLHTSVVLVWNTSFYKYFQFIFYIFCFNYSFIWSFSSFIMLFFYIYI